MRREVSRDEVAVATGCVASYVEAHHDRGARFLDGAIARPLHDREISEMLVS